MDLDRMNRVWIIKGLRSYIGTENGMYRNVSAEQLGAHVLKQLFEVCAVPEGDVDMVIAGNSVGAGGNPARLALLEAGLSEQIPAVTVDVQCGSGLEAVAMAAAKIGSGQADVVIAGGMESCSTSPVRIRNKRHPDYIRKENIQADSGADRKEMSEQTANIYRTAKFAPGKPDELAMLWGAERTAKLWTMDKIRLNRYVTVSHRRAAEAERNGELQAVLAAPFFSCHGCVRGEMNGRRTERNRDEGIRKGMSEKLLRRLPPLLPGGEYITAGNACLTYDGAAFLVLCSEKYAMEHGWAKQAEIVDVVSAGSSPERSPESLLAAADKLLNRNGLLPEQITAWEYNEAFAVLDYLMEEHFGRDCGRYNIFGGALAYGHPYGASGAVITLHLLEALKRLEVPDCMEENGESYGIAAVAAAGGVGTAILVRRADRI